MSAEVNSRLIAALPRLRRFALSLTRDADSAEDLVQETCVRSLAHIDQWRPGTNLEGWLFRIARNAWLDRVRAERNRDPAVELLDVAELPGADGRQIAEDRLQLQSVWKAIGELPAEQQTVLELVCINGLAYNQAAEFLHIPIGTIMSRLSRARHALQVAIQNNSVS